MKIGTRVALKGDDFQDPGVIVAIRRSDDLYASGKLRKNGRGELWAMVEWQGLTVNGIGSGSGAQRGYMLSELVDLDAPDQEA
jgi:hypothetical protein